MTGDPQAPKLNRSPSNGFVVAMRARACRRRPALHYEWLIVARWGQQGEFLSVSWTGHVADSAEAPIQLLPRRTVIGVHDTAARVRRGALFGLLHELPDTLTVAGRFMGSSGTIHLLGVIARLRLRSRGQETEPPGSTWDIAARRGPWIGEFIDTSSA